MAAETKEVILHPICYRHVDKEFSTVTMFDQTKIILHELGITLYCKHKDQRQAQALAALLNESLTKVEVEKTW